MFMTLHLLQKLQQAVGAIIHRNVMHLGSMI